MRKLCLILCVLFLASCDIDVLDSNSKLVYSDNGSPKNCRAIITENIRAWRNRQYRAEDVLESIDRNCGEYGYSW